MKTYVKPELEIVNFATESIAVTQYGNYGYDRSMEQGPESTTENDTGI